MYEDETPEAIKARILANITKMDTREGSFADDMAGPIAVEISKMYSALNAVRYMVWVDETSGIYLDLAAEDLGMEPRKEGVKAEAVLELTGKAGYIVPAGSSFFTEDNLYFAMEKDAEIPPSGKLLVVVYANEVGAKYNTPSGTILYSARCDSRLESITNPEPAEGGTDPETDASLYARIVEYRQRPATSGNEVHYEQWAKEVPGVGVAKAKGLWDGPGTVKVIIADDNSQPVAETIREDCETYIATMHPIGPEVTVRSASHYQLDINATLWLKKGAEMEVVAEAFRENLNAHLRQIALKRFTILYNRIGALLVATDGVVDYRDMTINGQCGNISISEEDVPIAGEVNLECL